MVISDAVKRLPTEFVGRANRALAEVAPRLTPRELTQVGKRIRAHVDPDEVFRDEQDGIAKRAWRMATDQDGCLHIRAVIDPLNGAKIKAFLLALSKPKTVNGEKDPRSAEQRLADAFLEAMTTAMTAKDLPAQGGSKAQLIVTMFLSDLATNTGSGQTQDGDPISAGLMRHRLRCRDHPDRARRRQRTPGARAGTTSRFTRPTQGPGHTRQGCAFPGCDRPPAWTEAHHLQHWIDGGPTDLTNLVLLCVHHHHVLHEGDWQIVVEHGIPSFIPPRWVDPDQTPVRNVRVDLQLKL